MLGSSPKDRLLSSKDHELREMQNKLTATLRRLQEVDKENRTLRRLQVRKDYDINIKNYASKFYCISLLSFR